MQKAINKVFFSAQIQTRSTSLQHIAIQFFPEICRKKNEKPDNKREPRLQSRKWVLLYTSKQNVVYIPVQDLFRAGTRSNFNFQEYSRTLVRLVHIYRHMQAGNSKRVPSEYVIGHPCVYVYRERQQRKRVREREQGDRNHIYIYIYAGRLCAHIRICCGSGRTFVLWGCARSGSRHTHRHCAHHIPAARAHVPEVYIYAYTYPSHTRVGRSSDAPLRACIYIYSVPSS